MTASPQQAAAPPRRYAPRRLPDFLNGHGETERLNALPDDDLPVQLAGCGISHRRIAPLLVDTLAQPPYTRVKPPSPVGAREPTEFDHAFAAMTTVRADALIVLSAPLFNWQHRRVVELAAASRLPVMYPFRFYVEAGGLMSYGPNLTDNLRRAATYVDKILKGAKPADLPVEQPTKFAHSIGFSGRPLGLEC